MLENSGPGVWITDFGLVRTSSGSELTRSNTFLGTPEFASPEQSEGRDSDQRSDLFSFGSVLYLMATGRLPFEGENFAAVVYQIVHQDPPKATELNPEIPVWLGALIDRLLIKDPDLRCGSAEEVAACIRSASAPEASSRKLKWPAVITAAACLLALVIVLASLPSGSGSDDPAPITTSYAFKVVGGSDTSSFDSLAAAVERAQSGDVIEIASSKPIAVPELVEIPAGKFLTLRPAAGHTPTLISKQSNGFISTQSPLILEGLTFEQPIVRRHIEEDGVSAFAWRPAVCLELSDASSGDAFEDGDRPRRREFSLRRARRPGRVSNGQL